jgi:hypothetical protein
MRRVCLTASVFLFLLAVAASAHARAVLVISSYHQGYQWSDLEIQGVAGALAAADPHLALWVEHLDLKRYPTPAHEDRMAAFLSEKYGAQHFELVIVLDNPAFDLLLRHRDKILPGVPVVFGGVNDFNPAMLQGLYAITGVAEVQDPVGTLRLALQLHPGTLGVLAVHDYTSSGLAVRRELQAGVSELGGGVEVAFSRPATYAEAGSRLPSSHRAGWP